MTNEELDAKLARAKKLWDRGASTAFAKTLLEDIPVLVAEVRLLQVELEKQEEAHMYELMEQDERQ